MESIPARSRNDGGVLVNVVMRRVTDSWQWLLGLYVLAEFTGALFAGHLLAFTPLYLPSLGVSPADISFWSGASWSIAIAVGLPFLPFWGALADRYARQPIIVRSYAVFLAAAILAVVARNLWVFVVARALLGLSLGNSGLMLATLAERVPERRQGFAFAVMNTALAGGEFVGPLVGGPVVDRLGLPNLLLIDSVGLVLVVVVLIVGYRDRFVGSNRGPLLGMALGSVGYIARRARLRSLFLAITLLMAGWFLPLTYLPLAVGHLYRGSELGTVVGVVMGVGGGSAFLVGPLLGSLADRWGVWRVLLIGSTALVVFLPLPALAPDIVVFTAAWTVVNGLATGVFTLTMNALSSSIESDARGRVMTLAMVPGNVGLVVGPALGTLVPATSIMVIFPLAAVLVAGGVASCVVALRQVEKTVKAPITESASVETAPA